MIFNYILANAFRRHITSNYFQNADLHSPNTTYFPYTYEVTKETFFHLHFSTRESNGKCLSTRLPLNSPRFLHRQLYSCKKSVVFLGGEDKYIKKLFSNIYKKRDSVYIIFILCQSRYNLLL